MTTLYFSGTPISGKQIDTFYLDEIQGEWQDEVVFEQRAIVRELREAGDWPESGTSERAARVDHLHATLKFL